MAIGKRTLGVADVYPGNIESYLRQIALAMSGLKQELAITPGLASAVASVAITRGQAINLLNGELRLASAAANIPAIGIATTSAAINEACKFIIGMGLVTGLSGLTANSSVYLGNAGALLFAKPGAGMIQGLGYSLSATELFVTISQP